MGPKASGDFPDRKKWNNIFNALVHMIESLAEERKFLDDKIELQYDRMVFDFNLFNDRISQAENEFSLHERICIVEAAKTELLMGLKQKEAFIYKRKSENADSDLADFKELFDLSHKLTGANDTSEMVNHKGQEKGVKRRNEKLSSTNNSEVSALLAEKKFVWNQYNQMESDLTDKLRSKCAEVDSANEKIQKLLTEITELHSSNTEKDNTIVMLKTNMGKLESDTIQKSEEISKLSRELELLKRSRNNSVTPTLQRCTAQTGTSQQKGKKSVVERQPVTADKELHSSQVPEKGCRSSKRKAVDATPISETPKLFTFNFKVPKLKSSPLA